MGENNSLRNSILPSAISGGAGLLGSFLGSIASARQNKKMQEYDWKKFLAQNEFNHNEAQLARDFEEQMYTKYMDYDSQVEQALNAGVNPNAIIGNAGSSAGGFSTNAASAGSGGVPSQFPEQWFDAESISKVGLLGKELAMLDSQKENIDADTKNKEANTEKVYVDMQLVEQQVKDMIFKNEELNPELKNQMVATIQKILAEKNLTDEEVSKVKQETNEIMKRAALLEQQIVECKENIRLIKERINTEKANQSAAYASAAASRSQVELNRAEAVFKQKETEYQGLVNDYETKLQGIGSSTKETGDLATRSITRTSLSQSDRVENNRTTGQLENKAGKDAEKVVKNLSKKRGAYFDDNHSSVKNPRSTRKQRRLNNKH